VSTATVVDIDRLGYCAVYTDYDPDFVDELKHAIPWRLRRSFSLIGAEGW
jgi:hypothetical protein